jgi:hypothetical protein
MQRRAARLATGPVPRLKRTGGVERYAGPASISTLNTRAP